jgi:hypothetical protein
MSPDDDDSWLTDILTPRFESVPALMEEDSRSMLDDEQFDDELWKLLTRRIQGPGDLRDHASEVSVYYASRLLQWEVGNGGFVQAAINTPEWFELAEAGYRTLGKPEFAALIRKARGFLSEGDPDLAEASLERLDAELPSVEWAIDLERVRYVRANRAAFQAVR